MSKITRETSNKYRSLELNQGISSRFGGMALESVFLKSSLDDSDLSQAEELLI